MPPSLNLSGPDSALAGNLLCRRRECCDIDRELDRDAHAFGLAGADFELQSPGGGRARPPLQLDAQRQGEIILFDRNGLRQLLLQASGPDSAVITTP